MDDSPRIPALVEDLALLLLVSVATLRGARAARDRRLGAQPRPAVAAAPRVHARPWAEPAAAQPPLRADRPQNGGGGGAAAGGAGAAVVPPAGGRWTGGARREDPARQQAGGSGGPLAGHVQPPTGDGPRAGRRPRQDQRGGAADELPRSLMPKVSWLGMPFCRARRVRRHPAVGPADHRVQRGGHDVHPQVVLGPLHARIDQGGEVHPSPARPSPPRAALSLRLGRGEPIHKMQSPWPDKQGERILIKRCWWRRRGGWRGRAGRERRGSVWWRCCPCGCDPGAAD